MRAAPYSVHNTGTGKCMFQQVLSPLKELFNQRTVEDQGKSNVDPLQNGRPAPLTSMRYAKDKLFGIPFDGVFNSLSSIYC